MTSPARAAADLAALLPRDDELAQVARMTLEHLARTETLMSESEPIQFGTPLRDAAVDPHPDDLRVMRPVRGRPAEYMQADVDDPEFIAEVARRKTEGQA